MRAHRRSESSAGNAWAGRAVTRPYAAERRRRQFAKRNKKIIQLLIIESAVGQRLVKFVECHKITPFEIFRVFFRIHFGS